MIRISANLSKKVPLPGIDFSSQQYGASLEIEVSDADQPQVIQTKLQQLYQTLEASVDQQIAQASNTTGHQPAPTQARYGKAQSTGQAPAGDGNGNGQGNGNGRRRNPRNINATEAQQRAIFAICKQTGINVGDACADFNAADPCQLHIKDASALIDQLKSHQGNGTASRR